MFTLSDVNIDTRDFHLSTRVTVESYLDLNYFSIMAPIKRKMMAKKGRKVKARRAGYPMKIKTYARQLRTIDKLSNAKIRKKLKEKFGIDVPASTVSTWYDKKNMGKLANISEDRLNVNDKRLNPAQRPDVIVDMETILVRKVICVKLKGIPYTRELIQMYAINIFQKLISFNLYNSKGMRKDQSQP